MKNKTPENLLDESSIQQQVPFSAGMSFPHLKVPANACDCHHHIYDRRFPVDPNSKLRPPDVTVADYRLLQKRLGTVRNVIIQLEMIKICSI
jgi:hypothetical protein